MIISLLNVIQ